MTSVSLTLGTRYAGGRKRNRFGSVVSMFSLVGMALGVAALIVVLSVMNGFNREIQMRFQTVTPHLSLLPNTHSGRTELEGFLSGNEQVQAWSPVLESYALLTSGAVQTPAVIRGIDPVSDAAVVPLEDSVLYGSLNGLRQGEYGIVLGSYMARQLLARPGDNVQLVLPQVQVTPAGIYPRQKQFHVVAIFDSGSQLDSELAYVHIEDASKLLRMTEADKGYRVRLQDEKQISGFVDQFNGESIASNWQLSTWSSNFESLFQAMQMEKVTVGLLLLIIVLVAAFNIVSGLVMMVSDKRADMAVVRTIGATTGTVMRVFVVQGLVLGVSGIIIGACAGTALVLYLSDIVAFFERLTGSQIFDPSVFYVSFLPTEWMLSDFLWVISISFLLTLTATIIPAWQASRITPTEALSYKQ